MNKMISSKIKIFFIFSLSIVLCSCSLKYRHQVPNAPQKWEYGMGGFVRYNGYANVAGDFETAIADYEKKNSKVKVKMVGVIHIGDARYYQELQKVLDTSDLVLYEGVRRGGKAGDVDRQSKALYGALADVLGLTGQLEAIDYNRKHWKQCDMITDKAGAKLKAPPQMSQSLRTIRQIAPLKKQLSTLISLKKLEDYLKHVYATNLSQTKEVNFKAMVKSLDQWLQLLRSIRSQYPNNPLLRQLENRLRKLKVQMKKFAEVVIVKRNEYVMKKLGEELKKIGTPKKTYTVSIFYGAGHLPDFEERLKKIGYHRKKLSWIKAWRIDSQKGRDQVMAKKSEDKKGKESDPKKSEDKKGKESDPKKSEDKKGKESDPKVEKMEKKSPPSPQFKSLFEKAAKGKWRERREAKKKIVKMGKEAAPALLKALDSKDYRTRVAAAKILEDMPQFASQSLPKLLDLLQNDKKAYVRQVAAIAIGNLKPTDQKMVDALIEILEKDPNSSVKNNVAFALGKVKGAEKKALPGLKKIARHKDDKVRAYVALAFRQIGTKDDEVLKILMENLNSSDRYVKRYTVGALGKMGAKAAPAATSLAKVLKESGKNSYLKRKIIRTLGYIGPQAAPAVPELAKCLEDSERYVRRYAMQTLGKIGKKGEVAVPALIKALKKEKDDWNQRYCIRALGEFGEEAAPAVSAIIPHLKSKNQWVVRDSIRALGKIGPKAKAALPALKNLQKNKSYGIRYMAKQAVEKIEKKK